MSGILSSKGRIRFTGWKIIYRSLENSYPFIFLPNFRGIILLIVFEVCSVFVRLLSRNIGSDDELKKKRKKEKKRWRSDFVLISVAGKRRLWWYAPLVVEGEDWSCGRIRQSCKKSNEKELKSRRGSGERGSFNGFRKKETAGRSSGREKGENKI